METILDYLDEIEEILESSENKKSIFSSGGRLSVDKGALSDVLLRIRLDLPVEIDKAQRIVADHERILEDAKRKASIIIEEARSDISKRVDEHEIAGLAYERAREIVDEAKADSKEMRQNAMEYADGLLEKVEDSLRSAMTLLNQSTRGIDELINSNLEMINNNRKELQDNIKPSKASQRTVLGEDDYDY